MSVIKSDREMAIASDAGPDFGGGYFNPPDDLLQSSRRLTLDPSLLDVEGMNLETETCPTYLVSRLHTQLTSQLAPNESLFAVYERRTFIMAPYIHSPQRLLDFERQVANNSLLRVGFYAVSNDLADEGLLRDFA
jgi:hypothetical protein